VRCSYATTPTNAGSLTPMEHDVVRLLAVDRPNYLAATTNPRMIASMSDDCVTASSARLVMVS
jgi:hypothetical protein